MHRPRSSQNIGSAARALANTGAGELWVVEPEGFDRAQAARLAAGADEQLEQMKVVRTLEEALADCVDVVMTTGRVIEGMPALDPEAAAKRLLGAEGAGTTAQASAPVALVFGDEVRGLDNAHLRRAGALSTIPTVEKASINLAQSVLIFGYEVMRARGNGRLGGHGERLAGAKSVERPQEDPRAHDEPAPEKLVQLLRERARALLLQAGFLNPQQPDVIWEGLLRALKRAQPTKREVELLLAASGQLQRQLTEPGP
ncbi:MAG: RNA methyltransferase [Deltaproteobacteria bacterium]|nr:RNA methyltransferase [Deltaproteobacteria bacterium]